jgi:hypothetical protein
VWLAFALVEARESARAVEMLRSLIPQTTNVTTRVFQKNLLGNALYDLRLYGDAIPVLREAVAGYQSAGAKQLGLVVSLHNLGRSLDEIGEHVEAVAVLSACLARHIEAGNGRTSNYCATLMHLAKVRER